jgi:hypothetical protein
VKWGLFSQACCSLNKDTLMTFFISYVCRVPANIITKSSYCFWKFHRNSGWGFCIMGCPYFGLILISCLHPTIGSWWLLTTSIYLEYIYFNFNRIFFFFCNYFKRYKKVPLFHVFHKIYKEWLLEGYDPAACHKLESNKTTMSAITT